jgi:hypothetical protein
VDYNPHFRGVVVAENTVSTVKSLLLVTTRF